MIFCLYFKQLLSKASGPFCPMVTSLRCLLHRMLCHDLLPSSHDFLWLLCFKLFHLLSSTPPLVLRSLVLHPHLPLPALFCYLLPPLQCSSSCFTLHLSFFPLLYQFSFYFSCSVLNPPHVPDPRIIMDCDVLSCI